jgi:hypothetical protein
MADDIATRGLTGRKRADRSRVSSNGPHDIVWWTEKFGVSEQALRDAVKKAGVSAQDVATLLKH